LAKSTNTWGLGVIRNNQNMIKELFSGYSKKDCRIFVALIKTISVLCMNEEDREMYKKDLNI